MRRSICLCEPSSVKAGTRATWKFIYTSAMDLPKGALLKFDILSQGKLCDWEIPQTNLQTKQNLIWAEIPTFKKPIKAKQIESSSQISSQFEFMLPEKISAGETFTILIGSPDSNSTLANKAQNFVQRKRNFLLYIDPKGRGDYKESETFHLDVKGNLLKNLKIIIPSIVSRNRRFDVMVRFEDDYGNLTNFAPEGTLIELSYENLRENLSWKLFVPETGFLTLPNIYFNEPGIYRIKLKNLKTNEQFLSPPIKCFSESDLSLYWGLFHGESEKADALENIENCLRNFRDEQSLQFYASSSFDSTEETSSENWKNVCHFIAEFNEDQRFTTFCSSQWQGNPKEEGVRQFLFAKDMKVMLRKKDLKSNSLKKIYKTTLPKDMISIPSFTMGSVCPFDFKDYNPDFEKVVEIYNAWGSSECTAKEGNARPIKGKQSSEDPEGSIRAALNKNYRFGFIAGGLDDRGIYSSFYDNKQTQYSSGLTAIFAKDQTRESLWEAINQRACYATTGERIILGFYIAEVFMGGILSTQSKPGLLFNRYISGFVIGSEALKTVEIIRNGKVFHSFAVNNNHLDFTLDDSEPLNEISLTTQDNSSLFSYYYLRVVQKDGHMAWSSPIWIDSQEKNNQKKSKSKKG